MQFCTSVIGGIRYILVLFQADTPPTVDMQCTELNTKVHRVPHVPVNSVRLPDWHPALCLKSAV